MKKGVINGILIAIVCVMVSLISVFCFFTGKLKREQAQLEDKTDVTFEGINMELDGLKGTICSYIQRNRALYILTEEIERTESIECYRIYSMSIEDDATQCILTRKGEKIKYFCVDDNENIVYITGNEVNNKQIIEVVKTDKAGNEVARKNLKEVVGSDAINLCGMLADQNGQFVLACKDNIFFLDDLLQVSGKVQPKQDVFVDVALARTGQLVCVTDQLNTESVSMKVSMLDSKKKQWEEDVAIDLDIYLPCDYVMDGVDCDFCYKGSDGIYGYDLVSKEYKEIIDYGASYMMNVDTDGMINVGENRFVGKTEHFVDNVIQITLVSYEKKDENAVTSKQKITLGTMYPGNDLKSAIAKYNRSNADYEVVIEDYSDMEMDRLLADFVSGKGQDIIDMNTFPLSVAQCVSKGMLEDLSPYYDSDEELSMDDLM